MKKLKKNLPLSKLVISKLTDRTSITGGSEGCNTLKSRRLNDPACKLTKEIC